MLFMVFKLDRYTTGFELKLLSLNTQCYAYQARTKTFLGYLRRRLADMNYVNANLWLNIPRIWLLQTLQYFVAGDNQRNVRSMKENDRFLHDGVCCNLSKRDFNQQVTLYPSFFFFRRQLIMIVTAVLLNS